MDIEMTKRKRRFASTEEGRKRKINISRNAFLGAIVELIQGLVLIREHRTHFNKSCMKKITKYLYFIFVEFF